MIALKMFSFLVILCSLKVLRMGCSKVKHQMYWISITFLQLAIMKMDILLFSMWIFSPQLYTLIFLLQSFCYLSQVRFFPPLGSSMSIFVSYGRERHFLWCLPECPFWTSWEVQPQGIKQKKREIPGSSVSHLQVS